MSTEQSSLTTVGLFAGIGGIELGLERAGFTTSMLCEFMPEAKAVLRRRFPSSELRGDIRELVNKSSYRLPNAKVVSAGFPCQDLSQCGKTAGIRGEKSGLVDCLLELLSRRARGPEWLLVENVPFMLHLERGRAMRHLTDALENLGFAWAYRKVDARAFGLPQRRERVILVASRTADPRPILFADEHGMPHFDAQVDDRPRGFYWTEGNTGLGWAIDCVPTLKAGSSVGIPSPPAIWLPAYDEFVTPTIADAESMQGLPRGWSSLAHLRPVVSPRHRWKLVGNAVPVPIAQWVGTNINNPGTALNLDETRLRKSDPWPRAAWGGSGQRFAVDASSWPVRNQWKGLSARFGSKGQRLRGRPILSHRAAKGFCGRIQRSSLRTEPRFIPSLERFIERRHYDLT